MTGRELVGQTLGERYHLLQLLGAGGMGAVYRAHDRELDELVALKVIRSDRANLPGMVAAFRQEVKLARRVTHVNIARTFELGFADGLVFCTMEYVEGESLRRRLEREGPLPVAQAVSIARALCDGLAAAHAADVIHRDIKPDNVLLATDGRVVLADFGVATLEAVHDGGLVGTLEYMAPEQARGEAPSFAADVYAVGLVLYEMLSGLRAFAGSMSELIVAKQDVERVTFELAEIVAPNVPADLAKIVERATARELAERFKSASELSRALGPWSREEVAPRRAEIFETPRSLVTIVVLAPRAPKHPLLYLAQGVHQALLQRLAVLPGVRVWPRHEAVELEDATHVELAVGDPLGVTIRRDHTTTTLQLPLDVASIDSTANAIAGAVDALATRRPDPSAEVADLVLKARGLIHETAFTGVPDAFALLERAHSRAPDDPRAAAELASMLVRFTLSGPELEPRFARARRLVEIALARAPRLAESNLAAGHLELQTGDAVQAAIHFRTAIACLPYLAEPHEGIGRMLLEAGFLDDAVARLDDALAIAPNIKFARWDLARAHALEQNWVYYDDLVRELERDGDRPVLRMRCAWWRGDREYLEVAVAKFAANPLLFEAELMHQLLHVARGGDWARAAAPIRAQVGRSGSNRRTIAFLAQLAAEAASFAGDVSAALDYLGRAVELGLFDLHWLDRCPLLASVRSVPAYAELRAIVERRAHAILDALYCDRTLATL